MPSVRGRAALAAVICEAAPLLASALAEVSRPGSLKITYTHTGVTITAWAPEYLAEAEAALAITFASVGWGLTNIYGPGSRHESLCFQAPITVTHQDIYETRCLYCQRSGEQPYRGCCSARCAYLEHDKD